MALMPSDELPRLEALLKAAATEVDELRATVTALAGAQRAQPTDEGREPLQAAKSRLAAACERLDAARIAVRICSTTGSRYGIIADDRTVVGLIAVLIPAGASRRQRVEAMGAALDEPLGAAASQLAVLLATSPERYARERPGRDEEGRIVFDVAGTVEGDVLVPAVSARARAAK
jgi:hypothetical protein